MPTPPVDLSNSSQETQATLRQALWTAVGGGRGGLKLSRLRVVDQRLEG